MYLKNDVKKRSYASLVTQTKRETPTVDISVSDKVGAWLIEGYARAFHCVKCSAECCKY